MAYDSENKTLYTTVDENGDPIGISLDEIAACLGDTSVGDKGFDLGTLGCSAKINLLSKFKPTDYPKMFSDANYYRGDGNKDGYFLGYDCYGVKKPYITNTQFILLGSSGIPSGNGAKITGIDFKILEGAWGLSDIQWGRVLDFDGYCHVPADNRFTNGAKPLVTDVSVLNPNGAISGSATLRYNWDDIEHEDGKSVTLGLKSLLACDGVNDKAYLGVVVYRTLAATPNLNTQLVPIGVAAIHTAALGTVCPNTGQVNTHNLAFEVDNLIEGYESSITSGYTKFYIGETGIRAIPFIAKWSGSQWYFVGLGVTPYAFPGNLAASGGAGSTTNSVVITKVVCRLRAVRNEDGTIQVGIHNNTDFAITVSGVGDLAFQNGNAFYLTPADGNSIMRGQTGVRLGISDNEELDLPVTAVNNNTYYASSLMLGRSSGDNYTSPPSSKFLPYGASKFKVGFSIEYYKQLKTWTFLNGSVEIDPANLEEYYTITIIP